MNLLGPPVDKAESPPSRVWTYRSQTCDVKLFFYPEVGGTTYRTLNCAKEQIVFLHRSASPAAKIIIPASCLAASSSASQLLAR